MKNQISNFINLLGKVLKNELGSGMVEYALIAALLACGTTVGERSVAQSVTGAYTQIASSLDSALGTPGTPSKAGKGNKGNKGNKGDKGNKGGKKGKA